MRSRPIWILIAAWVLGAMTVRGDTNTSLAPAGMRADFDQWQAQQQQEFKANFQQQREEIRAVHEAVKNQYDVSKAEAVLDRTREEHAMTRDFLVQQHAENMELLQRVLSRNRKLDETQKTNLTQFLDLQYWTSVNYRDEEFNATLEFVEKTLNEDRLNYAGKRDAIRNFLQQQRAANEAQQHRQADERREAKDQIKDAVKGK